MAQRKLLLADDSITIQKVINLTFADEGILVTAVGNGLTAVERLEEIAPDLVLADVHMPGLTGYEVCERVRQTPGFENIPVMLLVGSFEPFDETEARRVGADDFLTKPFQSIKQLVSKVHSLLQSSRPEVAVAETQPEKESTEHFAANAGTQFTFYDHKSADEDLLQVSETNLDFKSDVFDDEMIETNQSSQFADAFDDLDILQPNETAENEWRVVESENVNRFDDFSVVQDDAPALELDDDSINPQFGESRGSVETEDAIDLLPEIDLANSNQYSNDSFELETGDPNDYKMKEMFEAPDSNVNARSEYEPEQELNFIEQPPEEKAKSPFADLFDDEDLLGIEDEIRAEMEDRNFQPEQPESEMQPQRDEAITPEIMTPATQNQSQEIATVNQSTAVEKPGDYPALNFSPEVIDAIAARVVEKLSDKVIEKIAWEIVPDRFDLIVRKTIQNKDRDR